METEKSLVKASENKLPKFVQDAYDSIEGMKQFANMLLDSKLVPDSYYEKGVDNKPDYTKGKTAAVVVVLLQAQQLAVPPMTALQHIVPVNGLLSIKGDLAKTMIFASGKLKKDSWKEEVTGTIEDENMVVTITATREDNGVNLTRNFSVDKAKRMGLWVTSTMANSTDGWKWKKSAWFKTPDRMLVYRCLGNIARDLFSDVLLNMYTTEEAVDIQKETAEVIETESGAKITIPDKEHAKKRSDKITERVVDKIPDNKFGEIRDAKIVEETVNVPDPPLKTQEKVIEKISEEFKAAHGSVEFLDGKEIKRDVENKIIEEKPAIPEQLTEEQLKVMETKDILKIVNGDTDMIEAMSMIPGKNTNRKLSGIILAHQAGTLVEHVAAYLPPKEEENQGNSSAGISPNKNFDNESTTMNIQSVPGKELFPGEGGEKKAGNKYALDIPELGETGKREFSICKQLFNKLVGLEPQITSPRYLVLAEKLGLLQKYKDKEVFLRDATISEINELLNAN